MCFRAYVPAQTHIRTHKLLQTQAVFLWKLMACVPRKTQLLKSWLGGEHRWFVCVRACERDCFGICACMLVVETDRKTNI